MTSPHYSSRAQDNVNVNEKEEQSYNMQEDQVENKSKTYNEISTTADSQVLNEAKLQVGDGGESSSKADENKHKKPDQPRLKNISVCIGRRKTSKSWIGDRAQESSSLIEIPRNPVLVQMPEHDRTIERSGYCKRKRSHSPSSEQKHRKFSEDLM